MTEWRITTENIGLLHDEPDDCVLSSDDPIHELKIASYLGGLGASARLTEYRAPLDTTVIPGNNYAQIQRDRNIQPGTPEWFKLWFARPALTGEQPFEKED